MNNNLSIYYIKKKNFLELYEKAKNGKVDLYTLTPEILKKMCNLLEEEIKIKNRRIEQLRAKLNN